MVSIIINNHHLSIIISSIYNH